MGQWITHNPRSHVTHPYLLTHLTHVTHSPFASSGTRSDQLCRNSTRCVSQWSSTVTQSYRSRRGSFSAPRIATWRTATSPGSRSVQWEHGWLKDRGTGTDDT